MSDISRRSFLSAAAASGSLPAVSAAKASQKFDLTTDVLIAGGGAAGCMAAVEAAKKVLLVLAGAMLGGAAPRFPRAGSVLQTPSGTKSAALRPGLPNNVALKPSDLHLFLEFLQKFVAFPSFLFIIGCNGCTQ